MLQPIRLLLSRPKCFRLERQLAGRVFHPVGTCALQGAHNNASERALRVAALGRKNFLFVGHDRAGRNLAGLYSLVATCEANGVNARAYLTDVLLRVQYHPASRLDELLPGPWSRRLAADTS